MVFPPGPIPASDVALDESVTYANDAPFNQKQTVVTHARHRWFQVITIGTYATQFGKVYGLNQGATMRIQFEHAPDFISVSISGQTANTGRCVVYRGDPGGDGIPLGPTGAITIAGSESGVLTIVNVGTTPTYGVVIAHAGYPAVLRLECGL